MLGGGRALLAQAAHPLVAAGIVDHSSYRDEPWSRLGRTMSAIYTVVFGTRAEADAAARRVRAVHARIRGRLTEDVGPFSAGTGYSALDPALMSWVHHTLVENGLVMHRTFVHALPRSEEEAFYQDMKVVASVFGLPAEHLPATVDDFWASWRERIHGGELAVGAAARSVANAVLSPPLPRPLGLAAGAFNLVTVGLLAPELRELYGLHVGPRAQALLSGSARAVRRAVLPLLPDRARLVAVADEDGESHDGLPFRLLHRLAA
jgi:uncharacterized protein (DUF2236 family)